VVGEIGPIFNAIFVIASFVLESEQLSSPSTAPLNDVTVAAGAKLATNNKRAKYKRCIIIPWANGAIKKNLSSLLKRYNDKLPH
jgi:hypothetical protein